MSATRAALLELRDRLKAATGPDYVLSGDIALDVAGWRVKDGHWWRDPISKEWVMGPPAYTGSIDAAVTLVPDGWSRLVATSPTASVVCLSAKGLGEVRGQRWTPTSRAPTEPLALCLARVEYELAKDPPS